MNAPSAVDVVGPIDFLLLEFPRERLTGEPSRALADLVDSGTIRLYDLLVISKDPDGSVEIVELGEAPELAGEFATFAGAASGLIADEDVAEAAAVVEPGKVAALIVYENRWAEPFVAAVLNSGGDVVASQRIPASEIMQALEPSTTNEE